MLLSPLYGLFPNKQSSKRTKCSLRLPIFSKFSGGEYPQTPVRARACGTRHFAPEALIRTPTSKNPGYGPE